MDRIDAPVLDATLRRLGRRELRRRRDATLTRTVAATLVAAAIVAAWRIGDRIAGIEPMPVKGGIALVVLVLVAGLVATAIASVRRSRQDLARDIDRRLGLDDRVASALAVASGRVSSRLAALVVEDAESMLETHAAHVDAAFPGRADDFATRFPRRLAKFAAAVILAAIAAELLTFDGPIRILPGRPSDEGAPEPETPPTEAAPEKHGGETRPRDEPAKSPGKTEERPKDEPEPAPAGDVHVAIRMSKDEYGPKEPVTATVSAGATGELRGASEFDVRVSVDGREADTGADLRVDPSRPEGDRVEIDLRKVPGLRLPAGEHVAVARLTTRTTHEEHVSEPVKFRTLPDDPKDDPNKDKNDKSPKPQPKEPPPPEKKPPPPEPRPGDPSKKDRQPNPPPPPLPPVATQKQVVVPLFREGEQVKKHGLFLVLDPGGGDEGAPEKKPLGEALPDAARRAEAAVDRAGVRDEDRDLVRRYFELLDELRK
jgi:hypothetical protein